MEAARRLFTENGFSNTSMDAVTREAGVSKQTVYVYFRDKDELFGEVLRLFIDGNSPEGFVEPLLEAPMESAEDLEGILTGFAGSLVEHLMNPSYLAMIRMTFAELRRFPQLGRQFRERVPERVMARAATLLEKAKARGIASIPDIESAVRLFVGPFIVHVVLDGLLAAGVPQKPSPERIKGIVAGFMRSIRPATEGRRR
jgi:AcrR family transcriptional regulator